jgi:arginine utilization protein RocB
LLILSITHHLNIKIFKFFQFLPVYKITKQIINFKEGGSLMKATLGKWQTKEQLVELLCELVQCRSVTHTAGEIAAADLIAKKLNELSYFEKNPKYLNTHLTEDGRKIVTALVKSGNQHKKTIILVSHFDVVDVDDYGGWKDMAFNPKELTEKFYRHKDLLPLDVQKDLNTNNWLFGRGTMDMKCGLALHMSLLEEACEGHFDGNLLLLAVCDEEVNSVGMRTAVPILLEIAKDHDLEYQVCLNSEPMFTRYPGDQNKYIYTGSIGKVLPGFLCYGKETHVGEPLSGLNANLMASHLTCELELNTELCEMIEGETTPPPTNLWQKDLKKEYNAQIPHRTATLFNLFLMEKTMDKVVEQLREYVEKVARQIERNYEERAEKFSNLEKSNPQKINVNVFDFDELLKYASKTYGEEKIQQIQNQVLEHKEGLNGQELSIHLVDELSILCNELSPMIVIFFAPPYYPAISSRTHPRIQQAVEEIIVYAKEVHGLQFEKQNYFPGMSDLSYAGLQQPKEALDSFIANMPIWRKGYHLPLKELYELNLPVLNLGPLGRDAHKWTERLDIENAFEQLRDILPEAIHHLWK